MGRVFSTEGYDGPPAWWEACQSRAAARRPQARERVAQPLPLLVVVFETLAIRTKHHRHAVLLWRHFSAGAGPM